MRKTTMYIYVGHATQGFDYKKYLYEPLAKLVFGNDCNLILPHKQGSTPINSEELIKNNKKNIVMIADLSTASTGLGIELAWARDVNIPVLFVSRASSKVSVAPKYLWQYSDLGYQHYEYSDSRGLQEAVKTFVKKYLRH